MKLSLNPSLLLGPRTAAPQDAEAAAPADVYQQGADFEADRDVDRDKSKRTAWRIASGACVLAAVSVIGATVQATQPVPPPVMVVVDKITGTTYAAQSLDDDTVPVIEAMDKGNAEKFVRAHESYFYRQLQANTDTVARMSTPEVFARYFEPYDDVSGKKTRDQQWKGNVEKAPEIIGTRLLGDDRDGSKGRVAETTFDVVTTYLDGSAPPLRERFIATTVFEYRPKMKMKPADRNENWFGWIATDYRADPMVSGVRQ